MEVGLRAYKQGLQELVQHESRAQGACTSRMELGQRRVRKGRACVQRSESPRFRDSVLGDLEHEFGRQE
jgi:hypothetical protein